MSSPRRLTPLVAAGLAAGCLAILTPDLSFAQRHRASDDQEPPRVLLIGDSNMYGPLGKLLTRSFQSMGYAVKRASKCGSGVARPDYFDWGVVGEDLLLRWDPDIVIFIFGGNDGQRLRPPKQHRRRRTIHWREEGAWTAEYGRRVRALASRLSADGRVLYLLSPTNRRPRIARERMGRIRQVQREAVVGMERVHWVDTFALTTDENGRYLARGTDARGRHIRLRRGDGIHLNDAGAAVLHTRLMATFKSRGLAAGAL